MASSREAPECSLDQFRSIRDPIVPGVSSTTKDYNYSGPGSASTKEKEMDTLLAQIEQLRSEVKQLRQVLAAIPVEDIRDLIEATEFAWVGSEYWSEVGDRVQEWLGRVLPRPEKQERESDK